MLKFKMSLLLKSVKFKVAIVALAIVAIVAGIVFIPKNKASEVSQQANIKANPSGISVNNREIYVIEKDGEFSGYDNLFCIEEDQHLSYATYSNPIDISKASGYFNHYNCATWLLNNMYVSNATGNKDILAMNLANILTSKDVAAKVGGDYKFDGTGVTPQKIYDLRNKNIGNGPTKNALEVVEQIALWKYTKNAGTTISNAYKNNPNQYLTGANLTADEQHTLKYVYYALLAMADKQANTPSSSTVTNLITLNKSQAKFDENTYKVGPYYLESNGMKLTSYTFENKVGATIPAEVVVTKNDGGSINKGTQLLVKEKDGSFYIDLSSYKNNVKKVDLKINNIVSKMSTNAYVLDGGNNQNILNIGKNIETVSLKDSKDINVQPTGKYSIVLNKVAEDGKTVIAYSEAQFSVNGKNYNTTNGVLKIASGVEIKNENQSDTYEIKETQAPVNYNAFTGTLKLNVKFKKSGNSYIIDKDKTTASGFKDKTRFEVSADNATINVYVQNTPKIFDLSLRKFISKIDGVAVEPSREPVINEQSIKNLVETGTASYYHAKNSLQVTVGSEVEYTIRVYNEGEILGFAKQITDYLPEGLTFLRMSEDNSKEYTTNTQAGSRVVVINYSGNTVIKSLRDFINKQVNITNAYYQEVKIICKVENTSAQYITSRSEITNYGYIEKHSDGNVVWNEAKQVGNKDRDSAENTIKNALALNTWYENAKERTYKDANGNVVTDKNYFPGVEDDDDFETVELLSGKYNIIIKKVDEANKAKALEGAYFTVSGTNLNSTKVGPTNSKGEVTVVSGVQFNKEKQVDNYTIKETEAPADYNLYNGEVKVSVASKLNGKTFVIDRDNTKVDGKKIEFSVNEANTTITIVIPDTKKDFDLSLRKFITEVNGEKLKDSREPQVDTSKLVTGESTTAQYNHPKTPVDVNTTDIVTYTIRVFNEGEIDGYATKIMDDIPEGLEFLPNDEVNKKYGWVLYKELKDGEEAKSGKTIEYNNKKYAATENAKEADLIVTDFLSKAKGEANLIKAFDVETKKLDYKDVKVSFKVVEPTTSDRIITNYAQITEHSDGKGDKITDRDSTPNEWIDGEDDQDTEKVRVRYFDLALRKWVTKAIVYENGEKKVTETNHTPYDNPEQIVKVDLKNTNINNVEVKFEYSIRVINEGEIEGYAKEISDYIPAGLKFVQGDNPQWTEKDGKVVTRALENKLLQPGEYADVTIVLTWINGENNLGLKTNVAEISEDYNEYGSKDIDSTPNNKVEGEDDIDDAPVILAIKTGETVKYTGIAMAVISIISVGAAIIRKKVLTD